MFLATLVVGFVWVSFQLWRNLREDYVGEDILATTVILAVAAWAGSANLRFLWGAVGAVLLALYFWCQRQKWNTWEWLDEVGRHTLLIGFVGALTRNWRDWPAAIWLLLGYVVCLVVRKYYRQWAWYKSGKMGLVGLLALCWWVPIATYPLPGGVYLGTWFVTTNLVVLYLRSGRKASEDLANLWQRKK